MNSLAKVMEVSKKVSIISTHISANIDYRFNGISNIDPLRYL